MLLLFPGASPAEEWSRWDAAGARGGISASDGERDFQTAEVFSQWQFLPLSSESEWFIRSQAGLVLGWLRGNGENAVVGGAEASLRFGHRELPVSLGLGTGPRLLSEQRFGPLDLGSQFQFASFGELRVDLTSHWLVGYRFQHYSNAHLGHPNPGLNFHVLTLGYAF